MRGSINPHSGSLICIISGTSSRCLDIGPIAREVLAN